MQDPAPDSAVSDLRSFLADAKPHAGRKCQTCRFPQREALDAVLRAFAAERAEGTTSVPFAFLYARHLAVQFPGIATVDSVKRHARLCLKVEVA